MVTPPLAARHSSAPVVAWPAVAVVALVLAAAAAVAAVGPFPVAAGVARLAGWVTVTAGASVLVGRTGTVDLSTPATVAIGAYVGAVALPLLGVPSVVALGVAIVTGAAAGTATGALAGRVGGRLAALPSLSIALAVVAVIRAWPGSGGAAGYHAAPFLTGGETTDAVAAVGLSAVALAAVTAWWPSRSAARASVGARAPGVLAALGTRPAAATAVAGALGGALLGGGGAAQAMVSGSVSPGAFGLGLAAALALAASFGGAPPLGPMVGALWLWGPAVVFPLAPVVGDAPPLLTTGVAGLALLAARRGRALVAASLPWAARRFALTSPAPDPNDTPVRRGTGAVTDRARAPAAKAPAAKAPVLAVPATDGHDRLDVAPGEVVAVVGPNGAGKSTLLARIGGQVPDPVTTHLHGRPAPRGAVARARLGLARTWQRPPAVPPADLLAAAVHRGAGRPVDVPELADRVAAGLPDDPTSTGGSAQLVAAVLRRPTVVLLDEPATTLSEAVVVDVVHVLAAAGVAVVLVDHRPAVLAVADRTCAVRSTSTQVPDALVSGLPTAGDP